MMGYGIFLTALGWALLNSIWQMAVMWILYYLITAGNKRLSATGKHNLALVFITVGSEWFFYTFVRLIQEPTKNIFPGFIPIPASVQWWIPYLSCLYLLILITRHIQSGYLLFQTASKKNQHPGFQNLQEFTERFVHILGIQKKVSLFFSGLVHSASTSGFFKPVIYLPVSLITRLSTRQVEAIILHELFHIRRNDYLINILISCFRHVFFFNPFAGLLCVAVSVERELACDDGVVGLEYEPELYADALYNLEKFRQIEPGFAMAVDGNKPWLLMERISRILGKPSVRRLPVQKSVLLYGVLAFFIFCLQWHDDSQTLVAEKNVSETKFSVVRKSNILLPVVKGTVSHFKPDEVIVSVIKKASVENAIPESEINDDFKLDNQETPVNFAYQSIKKDFSNDQSLESANGPVNTIPGSPYVPTTSLYYEKLPEVMNADSIYNASVLCSLQDLIVITKVNKTIQLRAVARELEKNRQELHKIELANRHLKRWDEKNIRFLIDSMNLKIQHKKIEIENLQHQSEMDAEEIIHI